MVNIGLVGLIFLAVLVVLATLVLTAIFGLARRTGGPRGPARPRSSIIAWLVTLLASASACVLALVAGVGLGLFGLAGVALVMSVAVLLCAVLVWRRGALPLALVAASLAAGTTITAAVTTRIDRSSGLLAVTPVNAAEVDGKHFVRGLGSVLVDLRSTSLPAGSTTRISARSDAGRIVVALPDDRCVNLRVRAQHKRRDMSEALRLAQSIARRNGVLPDGETDTGQFGSFDRPDQIDRLLGTGYPEMPVLIAYGRTVVAGRSGVAHWKRTTGNRAPTVVLDLSADSITVRDYPREALGPDGERTFKPNVDYLEGAPPTYLELRGVDWPGRVDENVPRREKQALELARLAAGACATRTQLRDSWTPVPPRFEPGPPREWVNGLGQVGQFYRSGSESGSAITAPGRVKP